ncbi:outer membrane protein transport protein [Shewanella benthica]|uniref:OmpP1/FadL family transporter n=1 Tax=Shewanella benthica TaxID=43661 RepID=UPI0018798E41|nr:outer membrane protein transport protein [Shewanella benthica]MBE7215927.1 outer membrane protein transport protein [Shewanella benthica]MCL1063619.1 outer membrane protein transport protein [Shewanella benthica]
MKFLLKPLAVSIALVSMPSLAAGTVLSELGSLNASTAGAGSAAISEGAESAYSNPAAMSLVEKSTLTGSLQVFNLNLEYQDEGSYGRFGGSDSHLDGGNAGSALPLGSVYWVNPVSDKWAFGFAMASQGGSSVDYGNDWRGASLISSVDLVTVQVNASVSYKVNDQWAVGLGLVSEYASIIQTQQFAPNISSEYEAGSMEFGVNLGLHYTINEDNMLGLTVRSGLDHTLEGDFRLNRNGNIETYDASLGLVAPAIIKMSGYHALNDKFALLWSLDWQDWSKNQSSVLILDETGHQANIDRNWQDTYSASLGMHYQVSPQWRLEFGVGYESSPLSDSADNTPNQYPDLPVDEIIRVGTGATYQATENFSINFFVEYLDLGTPEIHYEGLANSALVGQYNNDAGIAGITMNWQF